MTSNERVGSIFKASLTKEAPRLAFYLAAPVPVVISLQVLLRASPSSIGSLPGYIIEMKGRNKSIKKALRLPEIRINQPPFRLPQADDEERRPSCTFYSKAEY